MDLNELLGIDPNDPIQQLAGRQVDNDWALIHELKAARQRAGLTVEQVAQSMGVETSVVARIESRTKDPHLSTLRRYALTIGVEVRYTVHQGA